MLRSNNLLFPSFLFQFLNKFVPEGDIFNIFHGLLHLVYHGLLVHLLGMAPVPPFDEHFRDRAGQVARVVGMELLNVLLAQPELKTQSPPVKPNTAT